MDAEAVIIAALAMVWGVVLFFARPRLLEFAREGGKGLRDRRVIDYLVKAAIVFLLAGGLAVMVLRGM